MDCMARLGSYVGYSSLLLLRQLRRLGGGGSVFLSFNQGLTAGSQQGIGKMCGLKFEPRQLNRGLHAIKTALQC